jgi:hypothetical protein
LVALSTRTELLAAIADWLNRSDLTSVIPDFISLAEAEMKRRLRRATESTTIYISAGNMTGPSDMAEPIHLRLDSAVPVLDTSLLLCTPEMLTDVRARADGVESRPTHYAYYDGQLQFAPTPDQSYDGILLYAQQLSALTVSNTTNAVLTEAPDLYLFGALLQAAPYLKDDERIPVWQAKFDRAIDQMNEWRERESYGGGLKEARLSHVIG